LGQVENKEEELSQHIKSQMVWIVKNKNIQDQCLKVAEFMNSYRVKMSRVYNCYQRKYDRDLDMILFIAKT